MCGSGNQIQCHAIIKSLVVLYSKVEHWQRHRFLFELSESFPILKIIYVEFTSLQSKSLAKQNTITYLHNIAGEIIHCLTCSVVFAWVGYNLCKYTYYYISPRCLYSLCGI
jgi:hypothetical protein